MDQSKQILVLEGENGQRIELEDTTLVVWIDETGHEQFRDPNYPIFGLGGCAVLVRDYSRLIAQPWQYMKLRYFSGQAGLHAKDLRPTREQLMALEYFFTQFQFFRIAAITSKEAQLPSGLVVYHMVATCLRERIIQVAKWTPLTRLAVILEASQRADALANRYLRFNLQITDIDGKRTLPTDYFLMPKSANEPGLEVADFIMHAAGGQTKSRLNGAREPGRKDFKVVFREVDPRLASFMEITEVNYN